MEVVRADHLVVPEQVFGHVLDRADEDEGDGLGCDYEENRGEQAPIPVDITQQHIYERERDEEEADVLDRFGEVGE